jgi:hypothetical protein
MDVSKSIEKIGPSRLEKSVTKETKDFLDHLSKVDKLFYWKVSDKFTSGIPDFVGVWRGRFFAIELKKEGIKARVGDKFGLARLLQAVILRKIDKAGGLALATDNIDDVRNLFT